MDAPEFPPLRLPPKLDSPRLPLLAFPNEREPCVFATVLFDREPPLKKCCELLPALRTVDGFAARPDGLKLSRDGVTGIFPVIALPPRNEAAVMCSW
jgi:hypothetical protein